MTGGSQQLRMFRRAIRDGAKPEEAAETAGIGIGESRLIIAEDKRFPPPEEAYQLLNTKKENYVAKEDDAFAGLAVGLNEDSKASRRKREAEDKAAANAEAGTVTGESAEPDDQEPETSGDGTGEALPDAEDGDQT